MVATGEFPILESLTSSATLFDIRFSGRRRHNRVRETLRDYDRSLYRTVRSVLLKPGRLSEQELLAMWADDGVEPIVSPEIRYHVELGEVPTDLLLAANRVDEVPVRQLTSRFGRSATALFAMRAAAEQRLRDALASAA